MFSSGRSPVWKIIKETMVDLGGKATTKGLIDAVNRKYEGINQGTLRCQITICTVNSPSRVNYPENNKPRSALDGRYDFLFSPARGELVLYDPTIHGQWSIGNVDGKLAVVQNDGGLVLFTETRNNSSGSLKSLTQASSELVFCPACKKDVKIADEKVGRCPLCDGKISDLFETELRDVLSKEWTTDLKPRLVRIREVEKAFDFVSSDLSYIGDAKFYKALDVPAAKWSTIAEYVWLLQFTQALHKFMVFGRDRSVPKRWLNRHRSLIDDVQFYFYDHKHKTLEKI
jgi:hypothetical protein